MTPMFSLSLAGTAPWARRNCGAASQKPAAAADVRERNWRRESVVMVRLFVEFAFDLISRPHSGSPRRGGAKNDFVQGAIIAALTAHFYAANDFDTANTDG